ncbi:MAG TPA: hypothetical protein VFG31_02925, partial [Conexibacter sp.]|nr:hypothetical protein [Conexibacter sp.]
RLAVLAREAIGEAERLPGAPHHLMTVAGAVAFYLSARAADCDRARHLTTPMAAELAPLLDPALAIFATWRRAKRRRKRHRRQARRLDGAADPVPILG